MGKGIGSINIPRKGSSPSSGSMTGINSMMTQMAMMANLPQKEQIQNTAELQKQGDIRKVQNEFLDRPETGKAFVTQVKDPSGVQLDTQAGQDFQVKTHMRQKASEDVVRLRGVRSFIDDLHENFENAFTEHAKKASGLHGKQEALSGLGNMIFGQNRYLRNYIDNLKAAGAQLGKFGGDTGNFTAQEQMNAIGRLAIETLNADPTRLFTPDSYQTGKAKFEDLYKLYDERTQEAEMVAETGEIKGTHYDSNVSQGSDPMDGKVIVNPTTGERQRREGGKWVPMK